MFLFTQDIQVSLPGIADLTMALVSVIIAALIYRFGPQANRMMLRLWVLAFVFLFAGGMLGSVIEMMGNSMAPSEVMTARLWLSALYMVAGLAQLLGVLEALYPKQWGKDLFFGISGATYLIILVLSFLYKDPDFKMIFLLYSSALSLAAVILSGINSWGKARWLLLGSAFQLIGVVAYFYSTRIFGISHSVIFNVLMLMGLLSYFRALYLLGQREGLQVKNSPLQLLKI